MIISRWGQSQKGSVYMEMHGPTHLWISKHDPRGDLEADLVQKDECGIALGQAATQLAEGAAHQPRLVWVLGFRVWGFIINLAWFWVEGSLSLT